MIKEDLSFEKYQLVSGLQERALKDAVEVLYPEFRSCFDAKIYCARRVAELTESELCLFIDNAIALSQNKPLIECGSLALVLYPDEGESGSQERLSQALLKMSSIQLVALACQLVKVLLEKKNMKIVEEILNGNS